MASRRTHVSAPATSRAEIACPTMETAQPTRVGARVRARRKISGVRSAHVHARMSAAGMVHVYASPGFSFAAVHNRPCTSPYSVQAPKAYSQRERGRSGEVEVPDALIRGTT